MNPAPLNWPRTRIESYTGIGAAIRVIDGGVEFIVIAQSGEDLTKVLGHIGAAQIGDIKSYRCDVRDNDPSTTTPKTPNQVIP